MGLNKLDLAIIALYLIGITLFGLRFRKRQRSLRDYFLAGRDIPWWAIALSIVAAETSTLTIISIPGLAYDTNLTFLQVVMGYLVGRVVISFVLLPHYFRGDLYTAYELIERRFGRGLRSLTAGLFLLTRAAAEGVRVYAVSIVVAIALGTGEVASIAIITALTLIYTFEGGLAAVIWTDVVQTAIYVGGTLIGLVTILHLVPGGWNAIHAAAASAGKLQVFDFRANFWLPYTFWAGVIGGTAFITASHGTDQLIVQRLLAARSQKQSVAALLSSGVAILFQFALFLIVGIMLWAYYRVPSAALGKPDRIYPTFIVSHMPHGISGLLIAAILAAAMSNLSAALNSLSSSSIMDFYVRFRPQATSEPANAPFAVSHIRLGARAICHRGIVLAQSRSRDRSRTADRIRGLRRPAGSVSAGRADAARQPDAAPCVGMRLRLRYRIVFVENPRSLDMVGGIGTSVTFAVGICSKFDAFENRHN